MYNKLLYTRNENKIKNNIRRFVNFICFILNLELKFVFKNVIYVGQNIPISLMGLIQFRFVVYPLANEISVTFNQTFNFCFDKKLQKLI